MRIDALKLLDFRGFTALDMEFGDAAIIAISGVNGSGKSSVLECLAILLGRFFARTRSPRASGRTLTDRDIRNGAKHTDVTISISTQDNPRIVWSASRGSRKVLILRPSLGMVAAAQRIRESVESESGANIPLAVYYPVNRAVFDVPLRVPNREVLSQIEAYDQALSGARNDFRTFFRWFRAREDLENEQNARTNGRRRIADRQLSAVRSAISELVPGFDNLHIRRAPVRMLVEKNGSELNISQLSDGEKCMLAMIGDLARRLAIANPSLHNPLEGEAVALIDEIELHLHPKWQRLVVNGLPAVFPNTQFVVTTHSAAVLSEVKAGGVILLSEGNAYGPQSYGHDVNSILEDVMGTTVRPQRIEDELSKLFDLIDRDDIDAARDLRNRLAIEIGSDDADLVRAGFMIRRKEDRQLASNR
jgi:predicted ATP-binding protein involved in virulence